MHRCPFFPKSSPNCLEASRNRGLVDWLEEANTQTLMVGVLYDLEGVGGAGEEGES